jgi:hypothetical protein
MKNLLIRWRNAWRRSRWERARIRHRIADEHGQDHLERQRKGIHDIPPGGGASF